MPERADRLHRLAHGQFRRHGGVDFDGAALAVAIKFRRHAFLAEGDKLGKRREAAIVAADREVQKVSRVAHRARRRLQDDRDRLIADGQLANLILVDQRAKRGGERVHLHPQIRRPAPVDLYRQLRLGRLILDARAGQPLDLFQTVGEGVGGFSDRGIFGPDQRDGYAPAGRPPEVQTVA